MSEETDKKLYLELAADIVAAFVSHNNIPPEDIPALFSSLAETIERSARQEIELENQKQLNPAVPIDQSLTDDAIICLEDGISFQSLKRHLRVKYNMTPEEYREKWGLAADYPMVAPNYAKRRSMLAKKTGLGKSR